METLETRLFFLLCAMIGIFVGIVMGLAQWLVLRRRIRGLSWQAWTRATAVGWGAATLPLSFTMYASSTGYIPSTWYTSLWYASLLGTSFGMLLGLSQWLVLHRYMRRAGWWIIANSAAWTLGLQIFLNAAQVKDAVATTFWLCTAVVAASAVHGLVLIWLLATPPTATEERPSEIH